MYRYTVVLIILFCYLMGHQSIELYDRLHHLIDYVENHLESQQPDLMLGVYMCEAQLETIRPPNNSDVHAEPGKVLDNIKATIREPYENRTIWESNGHNSIVVQRLLNLRFWVTSLRANNEPLFFGNLTTNYPLSLTRTNFADLIDNGAPSPSESDECLAELLNSIRCTISSRCLQIMSLDNESHGYHLTHKLLYFMLVKYRDCGACLPVDGMSLDFMIYTLCSMVWHERNLIMEMGVPNPLKDLLLEQTVLCGINGYAAFIDESIVREIVKWQVNDSGCFEYFSGDLSGGNENASTKTKRHAAALEDNCSDHMTGLAAAAFGLFAKVANDFHAESI